MKAATSLAALAIHAGATGLALNAGGPLVPIVAPTLAFLGSLSAGGVYLARRYRDKRRLIREAFQRYLEPRVVQQLLDDPDSLMTEGEEREMTFLFTDMENFSRASEKIPPRLMVRLLAEYFDGICEALVRRGGTIDKYVGDAVVAIFGAPLPQLDHAERAVIAAMEIVEATEAFRVRVKAEHGVELGRTRVGVNTGVCVVGNFGSRYRHNYTAFGDAINTANRLEGANKALGTQICVGPVTAAQSPGFAFLPLGFLRLRGKGEIVEAFTPVAKADAAAPWFRDYVDAFGILRDGGTGAAAEAFARIRGDNPAAAPAAAHTKRLRAGAQDAVVVA
jgi:adenylate cyclase